MGQHDPLGLGGGSRSELQHCKRVRIVVGALPIGRRQLGGTGHQILQDHEGRIAFGAFNKSSELLVDQHQRAVSGANSASGLFDERLNRSQAHR